MRYAAALVVLAVVVVLAVLAIGWFAWGPPWQCGEVQDGVRKLCIGPVI